MRKMAMALVMLGFAAPVSAGSLAPVVDTVVVDPAPATGSLGNAGVAIAAGLGLLAIAALADDSSSSTTTTTNGLLNVTTGPIYLSAGDWIELRAFQYTGGTVATVAALTRNSITLHRLGDF